MIVPTFIILTIKLCLANQNLQFETPKSTVLPSPNSWPDNYSNPKDSGHISDFTDPKTGRNPFVDVQEGRTDAFSRHSKDKVKTHPKSASFADYDSNIIEGTDEERARPGEKVSQRSSQIFISPETDELNSFDVHQFDTGSIEHESPNFSDIENSIKDMFTQGPLLTEKTNFFIVSGTLESPTSSLPSEITNLGNFDEVKHFSVLPITITIMTGVILVVIFCIMNWWKRKKNFNFKDEESQENEPNKNVIK